MKIGIAYDSCFHQHVSQYDHPECPERLDAVISGLKQAGVWDAANVIVPEEATEAQLYTVHEPMYVERLLKVLDGRSGNLDPDTFFSAGSKEAALKAAGGAVALARQVQLQELDWGFAVVRPPGHHAESSRPCGFCLLNNIAIAAGVLISEKLAEKVAIVDWDVHHGNGTQQQFYDNPNVLYISLHQWPHFPGSGLSDETGRGEGVGRTVNIPFPPGMTDADYVTAFERLILPLLKAFAPDHILVSAGFDAHERDPLAGMNLSTGAYRYMAGHLHAIAKDICNGRISFYLEGGYDFDALTDSTASVCEGLARGPLALGGHNPSKRGTAAVDRTIQAISGEWKGIF